MSVWRRGYRVRGKARPVTGLSATEEGGLEMRVMVHVKGDPKPGQLPSQKLIEAMGKFNDELHRAGVLLDGNGLRPTVESKRVTYADGELTVSDGPFGDSKEVVAGYWIWQVKDMDEAVEWAKRIPWSVGTEEYEEEGHVDLRPIFEIDEFAAEVGESPAFERERQIAAELKSKKG
jgi:hypothetical protein